jgi:alkanesulfonate monooxygenase SsuD/methylene tetrahydromethanopterin reductase-like flavin-dependent oxidoreductase (luciferase family)
MLSGDSLDLPVDALPHQRFIVGSPEDCLSELRAWRDEVGVDHFILRTEWAGMPSELAMRSLELLTDEVVPAFKGA